MLKKPLKFGTAEVQTDRDAFPNVSQDATGYLKRIQITSSKDSVSTFELCFHVAIMGMLQ